MAGQQVRMWEVLHKMLPSTGFHHVALQDLWGLQTPNPNVQTVVTGIVLIEPRKRLPSPSPSASPQSLLLAD